MKSSVSRAISLINLGIILYQKSYNIRMTISASHYQWCSEIFVSLLYIKPWHKFNDLFSNFKVTIDASLIEGSVLVVSSNWSKLGLVL